MANNKIYGFQPKYKDGVESSALLDQLNPYEFRKGMDYELTELGFKITRIYRRKRKSY